MADFTPLERMGRELKCPICLGILMSAVSLTCNHVFCNSCIIKSMKSVSCCPVCKVPYRRREIRPSPKMDNLVSVYKSMKVLPSSVFVTQDDPRTGLSDEKHAEVEQSSGLKEIDKGFQERAEITRIFKGKGSKKNIKSSFKKSASYTTKPCYPTKKRVQVSHNPPSEISLNNSECDSYNATKGFNSMTEIGHCLEINEKKELTFPPFFWLREDEEADILCSLSGEDIVMDTPMSNASSFSNVMESVDEKTTNMMGEGKVQIESNISDCFEGEMFERIQRPCSPELCSSLNKLLIPDTVEFDKLHQKGSHAALQSEYDQIQYTEKVKADIHNNTETSKKRRSTASEKPKKKRTKVDFGLPVTSTKGVYFAETKKSVRNEISLDLGSTAVERNKKRTCISGVESRPSNQAVNKVCKPIDASVEKHGSVDKAKVCDSRCKTSTKIQEIRPSMNRRCKEALKGSKISNISLGNVSKNIFGNVNDDHMETVVAKDTPLKSGIFHSKYLDNAPISTKAPMSNGVFHNCKTVANEIQCAFCHSAKDSEASGEMIQYFKGKPVQGDCSEGFNITFSHRNCTEWAPNVYFQGDNAINLESEVVRSRRIRCSFCGTTGAALGCYEKICRRSFHFTCAKLVAQCRWDTDNYVMLCPLHASSKLPNENTSSVKTMRKKIFLNGKSHTSRANSFEGKTTLRRCEECFGGAAKWVICCSSLTGSDKEIAFEFLRVSRASMSKQWNPCVTHVIASTDENGACKRTLKVLMGILHGKWILSIDWVKACMEAKNAVNEKPYEINIDTYGIKDGPQIGRLRLLNKQPKIFEGLKFYFTKDYKPSFKNYLQDLVIAAGGIVLHRKPILNYESSTFIIYNLQSPENCDPNTEKMIFKQRQADAEDLSHTSGANVASSSWLLTSIAGSKLQALPH